MKRLLLFLLVISAVCENLKAENNLQKKNTKSEFQYLSKTENNNKNRFYTIFNKKIPSEFFESGINSNKVLLWGGYHQHLYGYTDKRYVSEKENNDQGDYLKTPAQLFGIEFSVTDFSYIHSDLKDGRFGINICGYRHGSFKRRTLYAVPLHGISEEEVPADPNDYRGNTEWLYNMGMFFGIDKKWYEFDFGFTLKTTIINEKEREKLAPDSDPDNPKYIKTEGRGYLFDNAGVVLNAYIRFGPENRPNFIFTAYRNDYDIIYGTVQARVSFPVNSFFTCRFGGYLYQTSAVFLEPVLIIYGLSFSAKTGVIINYHDDNFIKAGIKDSFFYSGSVSYSW